MSGTKIHATHHERLAYVYVRQSTPWQVVENRESTERQYQLHSRAVALGWAPSRVETIDEDQGRTGSSATHRTGFQRLVSDVGLGRVGIVLMLEASRLARNNSDWYRLIEICGVSATLIADEGAVYNPRDPNDRLLLGVKGTLSEAELFTLRTRLYEGRWNKARKGRLQFPLPSGYVRGAEDRWELDPDVQVRERFSYVFDVFRREGIARRVVRELKEQGLDLPVRVTAKESYGALVWKTATLSAIIRILRNPAYAGAYVFGRWDYSGERRSAKTGKVLPHSRAMAAWPVRIEAHHPAYLRWEEFVENQRRLRQNAYGEGRPGVAREGTALLQGLVGCGICGRKMGVQHHAARERRSATYICQQGYSDGDAHICQSMASRAVDAAVVQAFLDAVSPVSMPVAMRVLDQIEQDLAGQRRQRALQMEQARYEARLAQRQYDRVDPDNRLVAAELERRWNEKLDRVAQLEQAQQKAEEQAQWDLTAEERAAISSLSRDLPAIWAAATTTNQERKRLLRLAIEGVQLDGVTCAGQIEVQVRWRSGVVTRLTVPRHRAGEDALKTPAGAVHQIHQLANSQTYAQIADRLNAAGWRTALGRLFTSKHVGYICRRDGMDTSHRNSTAKGKVE
ncbi:MAG: recombinase family protein [Candidatus Rokuibacteriota bacterium]